MGILKDKERVVKCLEKDSDGFKFEDWVGVDGSMARFIRPRFLANLLLIILLAYAAPCSKSQDDDQLHARDLQALKDVRGSLADLPGSFFFDTWDFDDSHAVYPCTSFMGLVCDYDVEGALRVSELNLGTGLADSPGLQGRLHPSIGNLTALQQLTLSPGQVSGQIPHSIGSLQQLEFLGISRNLMSGSIPPTLATLQTLQTLDLSFNKLRGPIPPNLLKLPNLQALILSHNRLFGRIQAVSSPLVHLDLQNNSLSAALPTLIPPSLSYLSLSYNRLSGNITHLACLTNLYYLDLSFNQLSGSLPPSLLGLSLHTLHVQHNHLWGTIEPSSLVSMDTLDLSFNDFYGPLSPFLATASNLYLNNNRFIGQVPHEFVDQLLSGKLLNLYLQHNLFTEFQLNPGVPLPSTSSLCIDFNCMETPSQSDCPDNVAKEKSMDNQCRQ